MTGYFTEETSVDIVNSRLGPDADARLRQIMTSLVRHAHAFVKDVQLTQDEWQQAIEFLTRTGQTCSAERQEFILLSDVLGVSMLVEAVSNRLPEGATQSTVLGPFHIRERMLQALAILIYLKSLRNCGSGGGRMTSWANFVSSKLS